MRGEIMPGLYFIWRSILPIGRGVWENGIIGVKILNDKSVAEMLRSR